MTCFFLPQVRDPAHLSSSRGCAINISEGVATGLAASSEFRCLVNGKPTEIAPVSDLCRRLAPEPIRLTFETKLRLGCGFGVSAACTLGAALAINETYSLGLSRMELGLAAHRAEATCGTGLGDVATQLHGGVTFRRCESGPLDAIRLDIPSCDFYYQALNPIETASVLGDPRRIAQLRESARVANRWLQSHLETATIEEILMKSLEFARSCGLLEQATARHVIDAVLAEGGFATMPMLGDSVLSTMPAVDCGPWIACGIDLDGTRLL